jgi:dienelactone hydrolase
MTRHLAAAVALTAFASLAGAQERLFYPVPPPSSFEVLKDQPYGELRMDVFRPRPATGPLPTLIIFNTVAGAERAQPFFKAWAEIAASKGMLAIMPDLRPGSAEQDFDALLAHLTANAAAIGVDRERIAVYAGSGNVSRSLPLVLNPRRTAVKAAVMYYGAASVKTFRPDLPILFVRAGLDRPPVTRAMTELVTLAQNQNAPVTILNYAGGHHAFEGIDDEDATRDVIDSTIDFVKRATVPSYQASLRRGIPEATAAAAVSAGDFVTASAAYAELVKAKPDDPRVRLAYGEALLGASQFAAACAELEQLKGKGLGPRDLGLPAARACVQSGNHDAAIAWLKSIPSRFLPGDVEKDPVFAPLQNRPDFKALFQPGR